MDEYTLEQQQAIAIANARARAAETLPQQRYEYTGDIPTPIKYTEISKPKTDLLSKVAQTISGGKYGTMQDFIYGGEEPDPSFLGKVGQIYHQSGIEGLAPEVYPLGGITRMPVGKNIAQYGDDALNVVKTPFSSMAQIGKEILPESTQKAYQVGKQYTKPLAEAWSEGKKVGMPKGVEKPSAIANYFKAFFPQAHQADVSKATSMSKQAGGVWDVAKKTQEAEQKIAQISPRSNWMFPENANIVLPEAQQVGSKAVSLEQARRAGQEATWLPSTPLKLIDTAASLLHPSTGIPFALSTSPRLQANLAYGLGRTQNLASKVPLTAEDLINLSLLAPRTREQK